MNLMNLSIFEFPINELLNVFLNCQAVNTYILLSIIPNDQVFINQNTTSNCRRVSVAAARKNKKRR